MNILVLNCGSSSLKYRLFDMTDESVLAKGQIERIGMDEAILTHRPTGKDQFRQVAALYEHGAAIQLVTQALTYPDHGVIPDITAIKAVGHRVVHGGERFTESVLVTSEVKEAIREYFDLAPLHNPPNLKGITAAENVIPGVPQVAVFDTAFHTTLAPHAYLYPLPYMLYKRHKIRRYGFHGTSHKFVAARAAELMKADIDSLKIITCHLGNGASITAVDGGKSVDTSMGFTPLEGLMMGTRSGDIDPAIIKFLISKEGLTIREVDSMLNRHSGVLGIFGISSDMRDLAEAVDEGNQLAQYALDMYVHRVRKYIGAYAAEMNGVDVIVFTAGIGENNAAVREKICSRLSWMGVEFDAERNNVRGEEREITTPSSRTKVWIIPTNEELMIARDTKACCAASDYVL
jgi:acetate kinase